MYACDSKDADDDDTDEQAAEMGKGSFGVTYQMRNKIDKRLYAVKMIGVKRFKQNAGDPAKLENEATQLAQLDHPNIVRYFMAFETMTPARQGYFADRDGAADWRLLRRPHPFKAI